MFTLRLTPGKVAGGNFLHWVIKKFPKLFRLKRLDLSYHLLEAKVEELQEVEVSSGRFSSIGPA